LHSGNFLASCATGAIASLRHVDDAGVVSVKEIKVTRHYPVGAAAIAAASLITFTCLSANAFASNQQPAETHLTSTSQPVALYITLCLWSEHHPAAMCREVSLTPGAAGSGFASMEACEDGQEEAMRKWFAEAGPVFGYTALAGDGYRIEAKYCRPVMGNSPVRE
jgi:hypothetical protein